MVNYLAIIFFILISIETLVGFIGNFAVILIYLSKKSKSTYTTYFFTNLSITDLLIVINCMPVVINDFLFDGFWFYGEFLCKIYFFYK